MHRIKIFENRYFRTINNLNSNLVASTYRLWLFFEPEFLKIKFENCGFRLLHLDERICNIFKQGSSVEFCMYSLKITAIFFPQEPWTGFCLESRGWEVVEVVAQEFSFWKNLKKILLNMSWVKRNFDSSTKETLQLSSPTFIQRKSSFMRDGLSNF